MKEISNINIEIDQKSGCCFGVSRAIKLAEDELEKGNLLYCLGDIVHNTAEVERLKELGLITISYDQMRELKNSKVLFRAHGEPPSTYRLAQQNNLEIIDATCPVVLKLQEKIRNANRVIGAKSKGSQNAKNDEKQIVILGKRGHAEVNGLLGQTEGNATVIENREEIDLIDFSKNIELFVQTTKSLEELREVCESIEKRLQPGVQLNCHNTICKHVSNKINDIRTFVARHDLIFFIAGKKSSNGKVLFNECLKVNPNSHLISSPYEADLKLISENMSIGICGATSTPKWQMEALANHIKDNLIA